MLDLSGSTLP